MRPSWDVNEKTVGALVGFDEKNVGVLVGFEMRGIFVWWEGTAMHLLFNESEFQILWLMRCGSLDTEEDTIRGLMTQELTSTFGPTPSHLPPNVMAMFFRPPVMNSEQ